MRAESSLFLQADLPANTVRKTNKLLFIIKGFLKIYEKVWGWGRRGHPFSLGEYLYWEMKTKEQIDGEKPAEVWKILWAELGIKMHLKEIDKAHKTEQSLREYSWYD